MNQITTKGGQMRKTSKCLFVFALMLAIPQFAFASKTYSVKKNETLQDISKKYNVPVSDLKKANSLTSSRVKAGSHLVIPVKKSKSVYKVAKGDTLPTIAK